MVVSIRFKPDGLENNIMESSLIIILSIRDGQFLIKTTSAIPGLTSAAVCYQLQASGCPNVNWR